MAKNQKSKLVEDSHSTRNYSWCYARIYIKKDYTLWGITFKQTTMSA